MSRNNRRYKKRKKTSVKRREKRDVNFSSSRVDNVTRKRPGQLRCQSSILLQTVPAQHAFIGGRVSMVSFSSFVLRIWRAAANDDPYADLFLMRIYEALVKTRRIVQSNEKKYRKLLSSVDGINVEPFFTEEPKTYPLKFFVPYSFMCAYLVLDLDRFMRVMLSAKYMLLINKDEYRELVGEVLGHIRQVLSLPLKWKHTGVTRFDVRNNTQVAQRAYSKMGELNNQVLVGTLRAPFAPFVKKQKQSGKVGKDRLSRYTHAQ